MATREALHRRATTGLFLSLLLCCAGSATGQTGTVTVWNGQSGTVNPPSISWTGLPTIGQDFVIQVDTSYYPPSTAPNGYLMQMFFTREQLLASCCHGLLLKPSTQLMSSQWTFAGTPGNLVDFRLPIPAAALGRHLYLQVRFDDIPNLFANVYYTPALRIDM